ncbi:MAG: hypothetical protein ACXU86_12830 [Archangium sp.]
MSFFVISTGSWGIQADEFVRQLRSRWPSGVVREVKAPESRMCLDFDLLMPHSRVDGGLDRSGQSLHFDSDIRDAAQLALWFRSLAPASEPMVFCDDSMSGTLDLSPDTTQADIFRAFDYTPALPGQMNYELIARGGWGMPVKTLEQQMRARWPSARFAEDDDPDSRWFFEFHVPMSHSEVSGSLRRKVNAMVFTGDSRDCAELALWCRSVVLTEELLLVCDPGSLRLKEGMTVDDILGAFGTMRA